MMENPFLASLPQPAAPSSRFLTESDFASLYAAADFASKFEMWFDTTVSVSWKLIGAETPEEVGSAFTAFTKCLRDWLGRRRLPIAFVYAHECGRRVGLHTHLILYIPAGPFRREFRDWAKKWVIGQVGRRAPRALRVRGPYKETPLLHWLTLSYLMKGYDRTAIVQSAAGAPDGRPVLLGDLIACEWRDPGPVAMKQRVGVSQSLGPERRALGVPGGLDYLISEHDEVPAHLRGMPVYLKHSHTPVFRSRYEDGARDVRRLYPADFYEKVTGLDLSQSFKAEDSSLSEDSAAEKFEPHVTIEGIAWT